MAKGSQRRVDTLKLSAMVIEASTIPIASRAKDLFQSTLDVATAASVANGGPSPLSMIDPNETLDDESAASNLKKVGRIAASLSRGLSVTLVLSADTPYSSDEEGNGDGMGPGASAGAGGGGGGERQSRVHPSSAVAYSKVPLHAMAAHPKTMWPVKFSFGPQAYTPPSAYSSFSSSSSSSSSLSSLSSSLPSASIAKAPGITIPATVSATEAGKRKPTDLEDSGAAKKARN